MEVEEVSIVEKKDLEIDMEVERLNMKLWRSRRRLWMLMVSMW